MDLKGFLNKTILIRQKDNFIFYIGCDEINDNHIYGTTATGKRLIIAIEEIKSVRELSRREKEKFLKIRHGRTR